MYPSVLENPKALNFLVDNLRIQMIAKIPAHDLEHMFEEEIERIAEDSLRPSQAMGKVAEAMPGFGILAAVLGIVIAMSSIDGPITLIGVKVAAALIGTFIGIFACYCVFDPLAKSLEHLVERETAQLRCISASLIGFVKFKSPFIAVDNGRKQIQFECRPTFSELEKLLVEEKG